MRIHTWLVELVGPVAARIVLALVAALVGALADVGLLDGALAQILSDWLSSPLRLVGLV